MISVDLPIIGKRHSKKVVFCDNDETTLCDSSLLGETISSALFKTNIIKYEHEESVKAGRQILTGQLQKGKSIIALDNHKGHNNYAIVVSGGKAVLCHRSYNPDGHTWSTPPGNNQAQHFNLLDSRTYILDMDIRENYSKLDKVFLINPNLRKPINVEYTVSWV
ncbi:hypothetical protein DEAC_c17820 [Desulfosporosinus acididurans]|uniref:Uncharacterized protein n=1 Tax=Desulfosporosinus acididurans TaxID=476652 RepID=A0A0J1FTR6_9FIRM|nr:hypothetical protein [Desulfosporosinus acididurans]KLU66383.1 hypothetical protein DEAC_c17820 [Desulfosporosinus acididurans]